MSKNIDATTRACEYTMRQNLRSVVHTKQTVTVALETDMHDMITSATVVVGPNDIEPPHDSVDVLGLFEALLSVRGLNSCKKISITAPVYSCRVKAGEYAETVEIQPLITNTFARGLTDLVIVCTGKAPDKTNEQDMISIILFALITGKNTLQTVVLDGFTLHDDAIVHLLRFLEHNHALRQLTMRKCGMTDKGVMRMRDQYYQQTHTNSTTPSLSIHIKSGTLTVTQNPCWTRAIHVVVNNGVELQTTCEDIIVALREFDMSESTHVESTSRDFYLAHATTVAYRQRIWHEHHVRGVGAHMIFTTDSLVVGAYTLLMSSTEGIVHMTVHDSNLHATDGYPRATSPPPFDVLDTLERVCTTAGMVFRYVENTKKIKQ